MRSSQTDSLPRGQTLHLRAPVPINTDSLPPAHRPSSSPSPSPTRGLELLITLPGHRSAPLAQTSQRAVEKAGMRAGAPGVQAASQPARETNQSAQAGSSLSLHLGLAPRGDKRTAWVLLRHSGVRKGVLREVTWGGGHRGLGISPPPQHTHTEGTCRRTRLKKFPVQSAHPGAGKTPALEDPRLPAVDPLG